MQSKQICLLQGPKGLSFRFMMTLSKTRAMAANLIISVNF
ncbi:hypothetical protein Goarm_008218 [Gossypium armourianum]|uniref:Uncharacterized protein n=1 Tax=Gossypium armourianum TaxID=34283 RepID=A0A7J9JP53_9ROSI|nr:hypothetical protein [Gossypium armourianum]